MTLECAEYHPFVVRFTLATGKRRVWVRWAPYFGALVDSLKRELEERFASHELPDTIRVVPR